MWLSLLLGLLTFLLSPKGNSKQLTKALLSGALVGGVTYGLTEFTDWGADLSSSFDTAVGVTPADTTVSTSGQMVQPDGTVLDSTGAVVKEGATPAGSTSFLSGVSSWWQSSGVKALTAAGLGAAAVGAVSNWNWPLMLGIAAAAFVGYKALFASSPTVVVQKGPNA